MPLLTDEKRIAELRERFPTLTHTSWKELSEIIPFPNVDMHNQQMGNIVCATSSDSNRDFYALRCNEQPWMNNWSIPYRNSNGEIHRIFIFDKIKDTYYEHVVSSENFIPIVSKQGDFAGEWVSCGTIKPISVKRGNKEDILKRTAVKVFIISDAGKFSIKVRDEAFYDTLRDKATALKAIQELANAGILMPVNEPAKQMQDLSKCAEDGKNAEDASNNLSVAQKTLLQSRFTRR